MHKSSVNKDRIPINVIEMSSQGSSMSVSSQEMPCIVSDYFCQKKAVSNLFENKAEAVQNSSNIADFKTVAMRDGNENSVYEEVFQFPEMAAENFSNLYSLNDFCKSAQRAGKANKLSLHKDSQNSVQSMEISSQGSLCSQKMEISSQETIMAVNITALELDKKIKSQLDKKITKFRPIKNPSYKCSKLRKISFAMQKREMNVKRREIEVRKREVVLRKREMALVKRERSVKHHEKSIAKREIAIRSQEIFLKARELKILNYESAIFSNI